MVRFLTELDVTPVGPQRWRLNTPLVCDTDYGRITVPARFVTDGASVPRFLWFLYPPMDGDYDAAAVLHDFLYQRRTALVSRFEADEVLLDGMRATNTVRRKCCCVYMGVRFGGWLSWGRYRRKEMQG